jgi:hypothetical protein
MPQTDRIFCPACTNDRLALKYEATYEYTYIIDSDAPGRGNTKELLPYLYDNREQKEAKQYIECSTCGATYPCFFDKWTEGINPDALRKVLAQHI